MARRSEGGQQKACCRFLTLISPRTCMNGRVRLSKNMNMFSMRSAIGRKTSRRAESWDVMASQPAVETRLTIQHTPADTTSNTGARFLILLLARVLMDMLMGIA